MSLADSYTIGTAPNNLTYVKQFADASGSQFVVSGGTLASLKTMSVKDQTSKGGVTRRTIDLTTNVPVPGSTTGEYRARRMYVVIVQNSFDSAADVKGDFSRLATICGDTTFQDKVLAGER